jgi:Domain of unknown function (DUF4407)
LDVDDQRVNGHGYVGGEASAPGDIPTVPLGYPIPGEDPPILKPEPDLLGEAAEASAVPEAASPSHGPSRWLRALIGVDESLLDRVWEERARYTCLGAIVLGTAIMAALSMLDALDQILGPVWPVLILVALFWGAFICGIDRWLIASTHGVRSRRWRVFVPRIFLALLFGVIIATPLVLTVFGSEVVSQAQNDQSKALLTYESQLKQCNPLPGQSAAGTTAAESAGCAGFYVSVSNPAIGASKAIAAEQSQLSQLNILIKADNAEIASLDTIARDECNGVAGPGLSGFVGVGPNCIRDRQKADAFASTSDVGSLQAQATNLTTEIATQTATAGTQTQAYATNITDTVQRLVAIKKGQEGSIGLLNRIDALGELAAAHAVIAVATVLLAIFIITVDCLPVLSKMMSGTTLYDRLLETRLRVAERMAADAMKVNERRATSRDEIELNRIESRVHGELERIDEASRFERAQRDAELDGKIAQLATEYRRSANW